jgi:hypothetical protein
MKKLKYTLGFELETQSTNGQQYDGNEYDLDEWASDEADEIVRGYSMETMANIISEYSNDLSELACSDIEKILNALDINYLYQYDSKFGDSLNDRAYEDELARILDSPSCYGYAGDIPDFDLPHELETGEDGSVDGFEFRTNGGHSINKCIDLSKHLFRLDHEIDTECSFHIHIAESGSENEYSAIQQQRMYNYLLQNASKIPTSVLERLTSGNSWVRLNIGTGKGPAISCRYTTWEFRLWGNVTNAKDAETCLKLTRKIFKRRNDKTYDCNERIMDNAAEIFLNELASRQQLAA